MAEAEGGGGLDLLIERTLTLADQAADRYVRLPVEVPEGLPSLQVGLEVLSPGAVIDLGCEDPAGWRGWSGGAHRTFTIGATDASPGYLPGPIPPGRWHVVLGIHALETGDAEIRVHVSGPARRAPDHGPLAPVATGAPRKEGHDGTAGSPDASPRQPRGSARDLPAPPGMRWWAGDTHAHSLHSDGALSLDQLAAEAVASGLDFLCVTDHGTTSHHALLAAVAARHGITLVPGQEITTHRGHANAFGEVGIIDARRPVADWAREVRERGGFLSINHPVAGDCSWLHEVPAGVGGVEILHSDAYEEPISTAPFAWLRAVADARATRGDGPLSLLGGGDFHHPEDPVRPGTPTTWVLAEDCTPAAIIAALRAGRTALTGTLLAPDVEGPYRPDLQDCPIVLRADPEDAAGPERVQVLGAAGLMLVDRDGGRTLIRTDAETHHAPRAEGPYRLETRQRVTVAVCA